MGERIDRIVDRYARRLGALEGVLVKGEGWFASAGRDVETMIATRVAEDMLPFPYQVGYACDQARRFAVTVCERDVQGTDPATLDWAGLVALPAATVAALRAATAGVDDAVLDRETTLRLMPGVTVVASGLELNEEFMIPNLEFHMATAYGLLRREGVDIGKPDFLASVRPYLRIAAPGEERGAA